MENKEVFSTELNDASKLGFNQERLNRFKNAIEKDINKKLYDGAVFIVARHGKIVMHEAQPALKKLKKALNVNE